MAAMCSYCNQEVKGVGCTLAIYGSGEFADGVSRARILYGEEKRLWASVPGWRPQRSCHDCGCPVGALHHPGCDMEECPRCGWQAISCGCGNNQCEDSPGEYT